MTSQGAWSIVLHLLPFGQSAPLPPSGALNGESIESRDKIMDIMLPLTFAWFRVRPFFPFSSSPLPTRSPPPCSTHLQSKALTLTPSSTDAAPLRCASPHVRIQNGLRPSRSTTWATL
jgi:hypothetical protein